MYKTTFCAPIYIVGNIQSGTEIICHEILNEFKTIRVTMRRISCIDELIFPNPVTSSVPLVGFGPNAEIGNRLTFRPGFPADKSDALI